MRILMTGGGTGGGVYPGLSVAQELLGQPRWSTSNDDIAWVGCANSIEQEIMQRSGIRFISITSGAFRGANLFKAAKSIHKTLQGRRQALAIIQQFTPHVVLATGGYVSVPLVLAAQQLRVPVLILLPDIEPGLAIRYLSHIARRVTVSFPEVTRYFRRNKAVVTGYPVRPELFQMSKAEARNTLELQLNGRVLLVLGGSRGARSVNNATRSMLTQVLPLAEVVHICGKEDYPLLQEYRHTLTRIEQSRYHLYPYLYTQMTAALAASDLVVARAGAATLAEFPAVGLPAVLVPYPFAGRHQQMNADFLAERGGGLILADASLATDLARTVCTLLEDAERLQAMSMASRAMAMPGAARAIAQELQGLAQGDKGDR
jgi:UDP-N-acetylglucosamine--N-acetylmuramyl-(pentapeptide) pyrophosphoryl-undecaprenol N-acetylglucosamine transferase